MLTVSKPSINRTVLMSGADYFNVVPLNPYEHGHEAIDRSKAKADLSRIQAALVDAGVTVINKEAPPDCQDGVFTANWGICRGDTVLLGNLPASRQGEQPYAERYLTSLGKKIVKAPYRFSGQGDSLPCGNVLFAGSGYRSDPRMHKVIAEELGFDVISLQTEPLKDAHGTIVTNALTGWPDSYFYDLDLALAVLRDDLIAWCPQAFTPESQAVIRSLEQFTKIEVLLHEAIHGYACNLISTGSTVIMSPHTPLLKAAIEKHGLQVVTVYTPELAKGGGGIRCCALTLDNS